MHPVDRGGNDNKGSEGDDEADDDEDGLRTVTTYRGETGQLVFITAFCLPLGIIHYYQYQERKIVCPECHGQVDTGAGTCMYCNEDLTQYRDADR